MGISVEMANKIMLSSSRKSISPALPKLDKERLFYWRMKNDFPWYSETFLHIRDKNSKLIKFKLNSAQIKVEALDKYCKENNIMRRYIILKARQMGISTYTEGKIFQESSTNELTRGLIVAHEEKASLGLFSMSKLYYEELPDEIRPQKKYNNGKVLAFENGTNDENEKKKNPGLRSNITIATAGSGEVARGSTPTKIHISELAFWDNPETTMLGLLQGVPDTPSSLVVIESTANGVGNYFHKLWQAAVKGENDFIPIFLPWFTDETYVRQFETEGVRQAFIDEVDYIHDDSNGNVVYTYEADLKDKYVLTYEQLYWRKWAIRNKCGGDVEKFQQEYPSTPEEAFISTGRPKFSSPALRKYQTATRSPVSRGYLREVGGSVQFFPDEKGYISIWKHPVKDKYYCIGADVAEGLATGDYSAAMVGDGEAFEYVAQWHGHIDADLFGVELVKLAKYYNEAYLAPEINNHGIATISKIKSLEYWNLFFQKTYDKISDKMSQSIGWRTTLRSKPLMIEKLAEFVREMALGIYSDELVSELYTYIIEDNGSTNAQVGCNDDLVIAAAITLQLMLEGKGDNYIPESQESKRNSSLYDKDDDDKSLEEYSI